MVALLAYTASMCLRGSVLELTELARSGIADVPALAWLFTVVACVLIGARVTSC